MPGREQLMRILYDIISDSLCVNMYSVPTAYVHARMDFDMKVARKLALNRGVDCASARRGSYCKATHILMVIRKPKRLVGSMIVRCILYHRPSRSVEN